MGSFCITGCFKIEVVFKTAGNSSKSFVGCVLILFVLQTVLKSNKTTQKWYYKQQENTKRIIESDLREMAQTDLTWASVFQLKENDVLHKVPPCPVP